MAKFNILKMNFLSPLHIGQGVTESYGRSGHVLHSDSLSGALASIFSVLYPGEDVRKFIENYRISSAYPFVHQKIFFPKPMIRIPFSSGAEGLDLTKKMKSLEYLDQSAFESVLLGSELKLDQSHFKANGKYFLSSPSYNFSPPYSSEVTQRVAVPRSDGGDASPFYFERLNFNPDSGFWLFYEVTSESKQKFLECFIHLGENGIGTDRTVGNGQFAVSIESIDLNLPSTGDRQMIMSLFWPTESEVENIDPNKSSYLLIKRGGFIAGSSDERFRHLRRKAVHMFVEGSVFNANLEGKIGNLRPEWNDENLHPVWRDGRAFSLPIIVNT